MRHKEVGSWGGRTAARSRLIGGLRAILALLVIQLIVGIWVNVYGAFPRTDQLRTALQYTGDPVLSVHYVLAGLILLVALVLMALSLRAGEPKRLRWPVLVGFLAVLWASAAGAQFVLSGFTNNTASLSMAAAWFVAAISYGLAQGVARRSAAPPPPVEIPSAST